MKTRKRRLQIPQYEFAFCADTFALVSESTLDGERLAVEHAEAQQARRRAEAAQAGLFSRETTGNQDAERHPTR